MATVPDVANFQARVIPIEGGSPVSPTSAFIDRPYGSVPLIVSTSPIGRSPLAVFGEAHSRFESFWAERRHARSCGVRWADWEGGVPSREEGLLLTYFKPELADYPVRVPIRVPRIVNSRFNQLSQYEEFDVEFDERSAAIPDPDTHDLVSATAAVLRSCVERALERQGPGERISHLTIGMPSFADDVPSLEQERARDRRFEAVDLARIAEDFGTPDFRTELYGEAEAAAWSVDIDLDRPIAYKIVVDVGAGTTDLALVEYRRERSGRYRVSQRVKSGSIRYAGRDLNLALALVLRDNTEFLDGIRALDQVDRRAWQYVMDHEVEKLKVGLSSLPSTFRIGFHKASAYEDTTIDMARIAHALQKTAIFRLAVQDERVRKAIGAALSKEWLPAVSSFIESALREIGDRRDFAGVEKAGGAFRFAPLRAQLMEALRHNDLPNTMVQFRDEGGEAQTMVARGLARWTALL